MFFQKISLYEAMTFYNSVEIKEGHVSLKTLFMGHKQDWHKH